MILRDKENATIYGQSKDKYPNSNKTKLDEFYDDLWGGKTPIITTRLSR